MPHLPGSGSTSSDWNGNTHMRALLMGVAVGLALVGTAQGQELRAEMYLITPEAMNKPIGLVLITSTGAGVKLVADLQDLPPGQHGFHVHENGDCGPGPDGDGTIAAGMAARGHYDPERTADHLGRGRGHRTPYQERGAAHRQGVELRRERRQL